MKKRLTKVLVLTGLLVLMTTGLTGCGKKVCDICGEEARCKTEEVLGEEVNICKDCQEDLEDLANLFD